MNTWFNAKCRFTKEFPDGTLKRVTDNYLVSALNYTDAEARITKEVGEYVRGEFLITGIVPVVYEDIFHFDDSDQWWKVKVAYRTENDAGKEVNFAGTFLVTAETIKEAAVRIEDSLKGLMVSYMVTGISTSPIVDIFPYEPAEEETKETN